MSYDLEPSDQVPYTIRATQSLLFVQSVFTALASIKAIVEFGASAEILGRLLWACWPGAVGLVVALRIDRGETSLLGRGGRKRVLDRGGAGLAGTQRPARVRPVDHSSEPGHLAHPTLCPEVLPPELTVGPRAHHGDGPRTLGKGPGD
jgi:hypothetical protein